MTHAHTFAYEKVEKPEADAVIYRMSGVLGEAHNCYEFLETFKTDLETAPSRILFNLQNLENMYSAGIGIVAASYTSAKEAGKLLMLVCLGETVCRTLTVSGVLPEVHAYDTEDEALAAPIE